MLAWVGEDTKKFESFPRVTIIIGYVQDANISYLKEPMGDKTDMRHGFTTGSCAAAAAKAAAYMLLTGREKQQITIETPKGIPYTAEILDIRREEQKVSCAVQKDGGEDPDITDGAWIYAEVSFLGDSEVKPSKAEENVKLILEGGIGVGRVTKPGLDQPVGNAAINHVPREMIQKEVTGVCALCDYLGGLRIVISVPEGERLAEKTFNPRLGIIGGISILGTTGIVEPMSSQALLDTIRVELRQKRAEGDSVLAVSPGNYGLDFMKQTYGYDLDKSVKCSNFIGDTIEMAVELGFSKMLLTGHIGKLVKLSGGIFNTHSKEGDCRMELLAAAALRGARRQGKTAEVQADTLCQILDCVVTEEAIRILQKKELLEAAMEDVMERIMFYLNRRTAGQMEIECILYSNEFGELARSNGADALLKEC